MTILAIDPGSTHSALVVWDGSRIISAEKLGNGAALVAVRLMIYAHGVTDVVCERVECYGMPVGKEVFDTVYWSGRIWQRLEDWPSFQVSFSLIPRREVKLHLCGQVRAKDSNIRQALVDRFGGKGTKAAPGLTHGLKADTWQAFALAVTCFDRPELLSVREAMDCLEGMK